MAALILSLLPLGRLTLSLSCLSLYAAMARRVYSGVLYSIHQTYHTRRGMSTIYIVDTITDYICCTIFHLFICEILLLDFCGYITDNIITRYNTATTKVAKQNNPVRTDRKTKNRNTPQTATDKRAQNKPSGQATTHRRTREATR